MRIAIILFCFVCAAQTPAELMNQPAIRAAFEAARKNEPEIVEMQVRVCEIPAPPFHEEARGKELARLFQEIGLKDVRTDAVGNVIGVRPGKSERPNVVFAAHLDTVFPEGTNVTVKREGGFLRGPGISDNCRGLATIVAMVRAMNEANVQTDGTLTFVANVGEEGLGDLRGAKALFEESLKGRIDKFVSIDGAGNQTTNIGVGSYRYKVTFTGPGGHSYGAFGMANPIQAMGRAIAKIDELQVPSQPKTTFNVGRVGGGTSVNSIPYEAWMEVDLRSSDVASLKSLDDRLTAAVRSAVEEENRRWNNRSPVKVTMDRVGVRPAGVTRADSAIVTTSQAVSRALGLPDTLREGSTDSNVPMNLGIPAITIGGGGSGGGAHSLEESFDPTDSWKGVQRAILLAIALAR